MDVGVTIGCGTKSLDETEDWETLNRIFASVNYTLDQVGTDTVLYHILPGPQ
jgi:hypothetical protein